MQQVYCVFPLQDVSLFILVFLYLFVGISYSTKLWKQNSKPKIILDQDHICNCKCDRFNIYIPTNIFNLFNYFFTLQSDIFYMYRLHNQSQQGLINTQLKQTSLYILSILFFQASEVFPFYLSTFSFLFIGLPNSSSFTLIHFYYARFPVWGVGGRNKLISTDLKYCYAMGTIREYFGNGYRTMI